MELLNQLKQTVIAGHANASSNYPPEMVNQPGVQELVRQALDQKIDVSKILKDGLISAMEIVGNKFSEGEYFVPEMLLSAQSMKAGMQLLEPFLTGDQTEKIGTVILGTVRGDMHDIGKNLVGMMLEGGGFQVIDLGIDTPPEKFVQAARENTRAIIGMSALLTTTMPNMQKTIDAIRSEGLKNKVIIGGAAISQKFADEIGADGFTTDAAKAVQLAKKLVGIHS
jgi:5-methyltetrahydrofolate--homocysteine methyltransferase